MQIRRERLLWTNPEETQKKHSSPRRNTEETLPTLTEHWRNTEETQKKYYHTNGCHVEWQLSWVYATWSDSYCRFESSPRQYRVYDVDVEHVPANKHLFVATIRRSHSSTRIPPLIPISPSDRATSWLLNTIFWKGVILESTTISRESKHFFHTYKWGIEFSI